MKEWSEHYRGGGGVNKDKVKSSLDLIHGEPLKYKLCLGDFPPPTPGDYVSREQLSREEAVVK